MGVGVHNEPGDQRSPTRPRAQTPTCRGAFYFQSQMNETTIRRAASRGPYVIIDKRGLMDVGLSWKAKGILAYILTKPDDWEINLSEIHRHSKDGRDATTSGFYELIDAGYADIDSQPRNVKGRFEVKRYRINEVSCQPGRVDYKGRPVWETRTGKPATENPQRKTRTGLSVTENPEQLSNEIPFNEVLSNEVPNNDNGEYVDFVDVGSDRSIVPVDEAANVKKNSGRKKSKPTAAEFRPDADAVLTELVTLTGKNYATGEQRGAESNRRLVVALMRKGYTADELTNMVQYKVWRWSGGRMEEYLRPSTLFGKEKSPGYIEEARLAADDPAFAAKVREWKATEQQRSGGAIVLTQKTADAVQRLIDEW